jgi:membrane fusion protein (multidrug efflux system)
MNQKLLLSGIAMVAIILVLIKIFLFPAGKSQRQETATNPALPVECFIARDTAVNYRVETVGTLRANEQVEIVSEISRKVTGIPMKEGDFVAAGDLLFKLDDADILSRINKLAVEIKLAEANEQRERVLLSKGGVSQERYDEVSNLRQTLEAEIEVLKVDLLKTSVRAPFAGKIGLRNVSIGALVTPGMTLATLQDVSRMKLDFSIPERYSHDLQTGSVVSFRTDYLTGDQTAVVAAVEPAVDEATRTMLVRAVSPNAKGRLVPGTSARVVLSLKGSEKSIFIPTGALIPSIKGYSVFKVNKGLARSAMVRTGLRNRNFIQVIEGVGAGDTLVVTNLLRVKQDSPLTVIKTD